MKKLFFALVAILLLAGTSMAQKSLAFRLTSPFVQAARTTRLKPQVSPTTSNT